MQNVALQDFLLHPHRKSRTALQRQPRLSESGTVRARYCCDPREVSGAKPVMKKCKPADRIYCPRANDI